LKKQGWVGAGQVQMQTSLRIWPGGQGAESGQTHAPQNMSRIWPGGQGGRHAPEEMQNSVPGGQVQVQDASRIWPSSQRMTHVPLQHSWSMSQP
jgi:hypothetical protein